MFMQHLTCPQKPGDCDPLTAVEAATDPDPMAHDRTRRALAVCSGCACTELCAALGARSKAAGVWGGVYISDTRAKSGQR